MEPPMSPVSPASQSDLLVYHSDHMSLITLPDHVLHLILEHLPHTVSFSLAHPFLHAAVTTARVLSLSHPPPTIPHLRHLTLTSAALRSTTKNTFDNLTALSSLTLPPLTRQLLPATKTLLSKTTPRSLTLHPSPLVSSLLPYLSAVHITALPHHPAFLSDSLTLIHALPLKSFNLHLPQRLLPHDELVAIASYSKQNNIRYKLVIPVYDYPFHTPHTHAPLAEVTIACLMLRHDALWRDLHGWNALERLSVWGAENGVLERLLRILKGRIRRICIAERDDFVGGMPLGRRNGDSHVRPGFWSHVVRCVQNNRLAVDVVDDAGGRGRDFVTLLLWRHP